ncbi:MAG: cyclic nucleotide-binding domain-containing protein [Desulfoarculaceae bacterium]|nr:cyclic nucleotide-binding domain-containing protein [Desulfoarculaceae bacterium]
MTDMVQYSRQSSGMPPEEIRDFLIGYHGRVNELVHRQESMPLEIEPSAGDGNLIIFDKLPGEDCSGICTRALGGALRMAEAIAEGTLAPTRMGLFLGCIIEAQLGSRMAKFGSSFAVANRLEELCGYFGTHLLMDREVARNQKGFDRNLVNIAKVSLTSSLHPMNIFTVYKPGIQNCPAEVDEAQMLGFIKIKNKAMELFSGHLQLGVEPDFPRVREELLAVQKIFKDLTGSEDVATERILEYIRETPLPPGDFGQKGMKLMEKKRDSLGERLFHLSKELLRAMDAEFYHALVVDTKWERYFKLEWCKKGDILIRIDSVPDGIYYLDSGTVEILNSKGELLSTMESGTIFGEMAYFDREKKRTATVRAKTDMVVRKISTDDFQKLPVIIRIFERIAMARRQEIVENSEAGLVEVGRQ